MTSRLPDCFAALRAQGRKALVTYIVAGDPDIAATGQALDALAGGGADVIEIGFPFSDPMADGPVIQAAHLRALAAKTTLRQTIGIVRDFRARNKTTPVVLMGYANPILQYGFADFCRDAAQAGVDGLIVVDLPPEEDGVLRQAAQGHGIDVIRLVTPTTQADRLKIVSQGAAGFLYYVSITGITGTAKPDPAVLKAPVDAARRASGLPVVIGFGVKTPEDARTIGAAGDGVVVGSALVELWNVTPAADRTRALETHVRALRTALDQA